jgi:hypothetical protein
MNRTRRTGLVLAAAALAGLGGCALQPWVQPFERERLADPIVAGPTAVLPGQHRGHVHAVREAARGATGVQGTGCGCN